MQRIKTGYDQKCICENCGSNFIVRIFPKGHHKSIRWCSEECKTTVTQADTVSGICKHCGAYFKRKRRKSLNDDECSKKCKIDHSKEQRECEYCNKVFCANVRSEYLKDQKFCSHECHVAWMKEHKKIYICENCGKEFTHNGNHSAHRFCSRECAFEYKRKESEINKQEVLKKVVYTQPSFKLCKNCNSVFAGKREICANCKKEEEKQRARERSVAIRMEMIHDPRYCRTCGKMFTPHYKESFVFCSDECRKESIRIHRVNQKQKRRGVEISGDNITIQLLTKRDKGICALCGKPVDSNDFHYDDNGNFIVGRNYPSIDHIKPISKGGKHTFENVQLAHHYCNGKKNDTWEEEDLTNRIAL